MDDKKSVKAIVLDALAVGNTEKGLPDGKDVNSSLGTPNMPLVGSANVDYPSKEDK